MWQGTSRDFRKRRAAKPILHCSLGLTASPLPPRGNAEYDEPSLMLHALYMRPGTDIDEVTITTRPRTDIVMLTLAPHSGHKIQVNASSFTVNDFECLQINTGNWPSERVHCELQNDELLWVVEHFDDEHCTTPNEATPRVSRTATGCYFFEEYNHSYNDQCNSNRTATISAFLGPECSEPMPVTAVNLKPED